MTALLDEVAGLIVQGNGLRSDFSDAVSSMSVELTADQTPQISLVVEDPDLKLWSRGLFVCGTPTDAGSPVTWRGTKWEVAVVELGAGAGRGGFAVDVRPQLVQRMSRARGEQVWSNLSASQWITDRVKAAGGTVLAQPSAAPQQQITRGGGDQVDLPLAQKESDLDVADRLAGVEGRARYWSTNRMLYGAPTWLASKLPRKRLTWPAGGDLELIDLPNCRRSADDEKAAATIEAQVHWRHIDDLVSLPAIQVAGIPQFDGTYLISGLTWQPGTAEPPSLTLVTPIDPPPQKTTGDGDTGGPVLGLDLPDFARPTGGASVYPFVQLALRQAGDRYVRGAGRTSAEDPDAFDCSGLVYWAAGQCGVKMASTAEAQYLQCQRAGTLITVEAAVATYGALLFRIIPGRNPAEQSDHVAISLGDGRTIEARGTKYGVNTFSSTTGRAWTAGAYVPGMAY